MRCIGWSCLQCQADRLGDFLIPDPAWRAWAGLIVKTLNTALGKAPAPFAHRILIGAKGSRDHLVFQPLRRRQHHPRPPRHTLRRPPSPRQALQLGSLQRRQLDCNRRLAHRSYPPGSKGYNPINLSISTLVVGPIAGDLEDFLGKIVGLVHARLVVHFAKRGVVTAPMGNRCWTAPEFAGDLFERVAGGDPLGI